MTPCSTRDYKWRGVAIGEPQRVRAPRADFSRRVWDGVSASEVEGAGREVGVHPGEEKAASEHGPSGEVQRRPMFPTDGDVGTSGSFYY